MGVWKEFAEENNLNLRDFYKGLVERNLRPPYNPFKIKKGWGREGMDYLGNGGFKARSDPNGERLEGGDRSGRGNGTREDDY